MKRRLLSKSCLSLLTGAALLAVSSAVAQTEREAPPYEAGLMRLAEILGALDVLRPLCGNTDTPSWREQMQSLLEAEAEEPNRRRRFIERFNQGHRGFASVYRNCTPSARLAMEQYVTEGTKLIADVTGRYGR